MHPRHPAPPRPARARLLLAAAAAGLAGGAADAAAVFALDGPAVAATLSVGDEAAGGRTYVSELYAKRGARDGGGATANLLFNVSNENMPGQSLARLSGTALSWSAPPSPVFCGAVGGASPPTRSLALACEAPGATLHVLFAAYGTGSAAASGCDAPAPGACNDARAPAVVGAACEGQARCTVYQGAPSFPEDPCPDQPKTLFVKVACSQGNGSADPPLSTWAASAGGVGARGSAAAVSVTGVRVGPFAVEDWALDLSAGFSWTVSRRYTEGLTYECDRGPLLTLNTQYDLGSFPLGSQIPSVLDPDFMWRSDGVAFPCALGDAPDAGWSVGASPHLQHDLLLSPSLLRFDSAVTCTDGGASSGSGSGSGSGTGGGSGAAAPCGLVLTWPTWPGVGGGETTMGIGVHAYSAATGTPGPRTVAANETIAFSWVLTPPASPPELNSTSAGLLPFAFSHAAAPVVESAARRLAARVNMFGGNIFGNSPASVVCLHEMSFFPLIQGLFASTRGHAALQSELAMFAAHGVCADGYVFPRWGYDAYTTMPIHDQLGHFILAFFHHAVNTGDRAFAAASWPAVLSAIFYINTTMNFSTTDLANTPAPATGLPNSQAADNWFDIVNFGGRDAIVNAYICSALNASAQLAAWLDDAPNAAALADMHRRCITAFNGLFWNESTSLYGDWVDTAGAKRNYGYVWQQAISADPLSGIADVSRAAAMAAAVSARLAEIRVQYNKPGLWCAPTNLWGVAPEDSFFNGTLQDQAEYGHYENGCCFMALHGMYEQLLAFGGQRDAAYASLLDLLAESEASGLWGQHLDWIQEGPTFFDGSDVLTDTLMGLRAGLLGGMGVRQGLGADLIWADGPAAVGLEGASLTFQHFGRAVTATVVNGTTHFVFA